MPYRHKRHASDENKPKAAIYCLKSKRNVIVRSNRINPESDWPKRAIQNVHIDAIEPEAISEWSDGQAGDRQAEVGHGLQGLPGVGGCLHESSGW